MTEKRDIYKCPHCGNIVEVVHNGPGTLVCCGTNMIRMKENFVDASTEKHVPVVEKIDGGVRVRVGEIAHPMEVAHYIEWIEFTADGKTQRKELGPDDEPMAEFMTDSDNYEVRAYCNLHGLWKAK